MPLRDVQVAEVNGRRYALRYTHRALLAVEKTGFPLKRCFEVLWEDAAENIERVFHAGLEGHRSKTAPSAAAVTMEEARDVLDELPRHVAVRLVQEALTIAYKDPDAPAAAPAADEVADGGKASPPPTP